MAYLTTSQTFRIGQAWFPACRMKSGALQVNFFCQNRNKKGWLRVFD